MLFANTTESSLCRHQTMRHRIRSSRGTLLHVPQSHPFRLLQMAERKTEREDRGESEDCPDHRADLRRQSGQRVSSYPRRTRTIP